MWRRSALITWVVLGISDKAAALNNGLLVPPMGWSSWYGFQANINEEMIKGMADAMVSSGLHSAGCDRTPSPCCSTIIHKSTALLLDRCSSPQLHGIIAFYMNICAGFKPVSFCACVVFILQSHQHFKKMKTAPQVCACLDRRR